MNQVLSVPRLSEQPTDAIDATAFSELYRLYSPALYRYLRSRCPSAEDAADLTATTFERAWGARSGLRAGQDRAATWLFSIARRLAIDAARRRANAGRRLALWPRAEPAPDPANLVIQDEADRLLAERLATLPEVQREALLLRYAAGLTARDIGLVIGKREAATQRLISRGLQRLREAYRDER